METVFQIFFKEVSFDLEVRVQGTKEKMKVRIKVGKHHKQVFPVMLGGKSLGNKRLCSRKGSLFRMKGAWIGGRW